MNAKAVTIRQSRVLSDRCFGNYQAEAVIAWDLEGEEGSPERLADTLRRAALQARCRVLEDVHALERAREERCRQCRSERRGLGELGDCPKD